MRKLCKESCHNETRKNKTMNLTFTKATKENFFHGALSHVANTI